jgi:prepilin-type N-terminal cleavage/methylation domain-containing protein
MKKQSGFTLIELLLVLAIIGIIAAIAIPALLGQREKAKIRAVESLVNNIAGEIARAGDDLRAVQGSAFTVASVPGKELQLSNYKYPKAKNPYGGTSTPYSSGTTPALGGVTLEADSTFTDPVTSEVHPVVIVRGKYKKSGTSVTVSKVVAID